MYELETLRPARDSLQSPARDGSIELLSSILLSRIMAPKRKAAAAAKEEAAPPKKGKGGLAIGDDFPDLPELEFDESTPEEKKTVKLSDVLKDHGIILFFYPKANTGGCTKQACGFQDNLAEIEKAGYKVFGMSADKPKSQAGWKTKRGFEYNLLSDPSYEVSVTALVNRVLGV